MPELAERHDGFEKAKRERLAPVVEAALARRAPARRAPADAVIQAAIKA